MKPPSGGASPQPTPQKPPQSITQSGGSGGQPGVGGTPPGVGGTPSGAPSGAGGQGGPSVKYDPSGGGASMPPPIAQPHEAVQSIAQLLMGYNDRKKKGEEAEAANIAQNLIQAMRNGDKDTVNDILNNDHSKKILNKVYKGWLTKMQEAQKPGKEPDPTVSGFEAGIQKATQPSAQPQGGQLPMSSPGGVRLPQQSQQEQLGAAKLSAETQAAQQDPNRLLSSRLSSEEMRTVELGAGPEKVEAEKAKALADVQKYAAGAKKAEFEAQKAESEYRLKQLESVTSKTKGEMSLEIERVKLLESQAKLDIAKQNLHRAAMLASAAGKVKLSSAMKIKLEAATRAESIVEGIVKDKRDLSESDVQALQNELKVAGATNLADKIRAGGVMGWFIGKKGSSPSSTMLQSSLQLYVEGLKKSLGAEDTPDKKPSVTPVGDDETDDVDADIVINPEDMEEKPPTKP